MDTFTSSRAVKKLHPLDFVKMAQKSRSETADGTKHKRSFENFACNIPSVGIPMGSSSRGEKNARTQILPGSETQKKIALQRSDMHLLWWKCFTCVHGQEED
jgi:hypothetical protein